MHDEFYSLTGKLKNISNSLYGFSSVGEGVATRRLPCLRYGSHYLEVEICHRWTLLSVNPKFSGWKNFENRQKHQRRRSAWGMGRTWEKFSSLPAKKPQKFETATGKENF